MGQGRCTAATGEKWQERDSKGLPGSVDVYKRQVQSALHLIALEPVQPQIRGDPTGDFCHIDICLLYTSIIAAGVALLLSDFGTLLEQEFDLLLKTVGVRCV